MIDARLKPDEQEEITPGEAINGLISLNGLDKFLALKGPRICLCQA